MFEIQLDGQQRSYGCGQQDTLLRAGLRAGLGLPYECNVGQCGSCKIQLLDGTVSEAVESPALSKRDMDRGRRLACQSHPLTDCRIRFVGGLRDPAPTEAPPERFFGTLVACRDLTHDMREFRFRSDRAATFLPGQYALLDLPGVSGSRAYSMANLPNAAGEWEFIIRNVPGGKATDVLFDTLALGDTLPFDAPYGRAYLRESSRDVCCIAGGSGLAPMLSIAREFSGNPIHAGAKLHFLFGGRTAADLCGHHEVGALTGFGDRLSFHAAASTESIDGRSPQFVHELLLDTLADNLANFDFYLAGPPKMIDAVCAVLQQNGVDKNRIRYDRFF